MSAHKIMGEGSIAGIFPSLQSTIAIQFFGSQKKGNAYVQLFKEDGTSIGIATIKDIIPYKFYYFTVPEQIIKGFSVYNNNKGGLAIRKVSYGINDFTSSEPTETGRVVLFNSDYFDDTTGYADQLIYDAIFFVAQRTEAEAATNPVQVLIFGYHEYLVDTVLNEYPGIDVVAIYTEAQASSFDSSSVFDNIDVFIYTRDNAGIGESLSGTGATNVYNFVSNGGGYIGELAGAAAAFETNDWDYGTLEPLGIVTGYSGSTVVETSTSSVVVSEHPILPGYAIDDPCPPDDIAAEFANGLFGYSISWVIAKRVSDNTPMVLATPVN